MWTAGCGGVMALAVICFGLLRDLWMLGKLKRGEKFGKPSGDLSREPAQPESGQHSLRSGNRRRSLVALGGGDVTGDE